jgi:hypothetical protein
LTNFKSFNLIHKVFIFDTLKFQIPNFTIGFPFISFFGPQTLTGLCLTHSSGPYQVLNESPSGPWEILWGIGIAMWPFGPHHASFYDALRPLDILLLMETQASFVWTFPPHQGYQGLF